MEPDIPTLVGLLLTAVVVVVGLTLFTRRRLTLLPHQRFGPEYERPEDERPEYERVVDLGGEGARTGPRGTEERVSAFGIQPLGLADRQRFRASWRRSQEAFIDDPEGALTDADALLGEVMAARGYPEADFDQRAADLSVDHAAVVADYRAAHRIARRHDGGDATTEDLRRAMIHYRALIEDLVSEPERVEAKAS